MDQRVSMITLGVDDLARARREIARLTQAEGSALSLREALGAELIRHEAAITDPAG
jgi:hypothetical protein